MCARTASPLVPSLSIAAPLSLSCCSSSLFFSLTSFPFPLSVSFSRTHVHSHKPRQGSLPVRTLPLARAQTHLALRAEPSSLAHALCLYATTLWARVDAHSSVLLFGALKLKAAVVPW
eukprot:6180570-Pleurochrysis_carterae.AAC.8